MPKYFLMAHPHTPELRVQQLNGEVTHLANGDWQFQYRLHGNLTDLKLPAPSQAKAQDGLWQHTCFEAFVQVQGVAAYYEWTGGWIPPGVVRKTSDRGKKGLSDSTKGEYSGERNLSG